MLIHNISLKYDHETKLHFVFMAQSIPSVPIPTPSWAIFSGLCHLVGPGGVEFVRKPLPGDGAFVIFFRQL